MARQVLPWVGMAVGAYFGNPQLGFMIGSMVGNAVDPQTIKGPALGEGQNNSASEGGYRPIVLGKGAVGVCMIHEGPIKKRTIRTRQSKGGGPVTEEERAYRTMAFALGESAYPDTGVVLLRLWIDNKLRYDVTPTSQIVAESEEFAEEFTFYPGNNDQLPDPDIEAYLGAGNVPSYRGGSPYIVLPDWDVTSSQGRAPMIKAELASVFGQVLATELVAIRAQSGSSEFMMSDSSGQTWTGWGVLSETGTYWIHSSRDKMLAWGSGSGAGPFYMERGSPVWHESGGFLSGTKRDGYVSPDSKAWIANGGFIGISHSDDGFATFEQLPGTPDGDIITVAGRFYMIWATQVWSSPDGSTGWTQDPDDLPFDFGNGVWGDSDGSIAIIVGGGSGGVPRAVEFNSFGDRVYPAIPFVDATIFQGVCHGTFDGDPRWLACANSGELAYRTPDGVWHASTTRLDFNAKDVTFNGAYFFVIGDDGVEGFIARSEDADTFEIIHSETLLTLQQWTGIEAFEVEAASVVAEPIALSEIALFIHDRVDISPSKVNVAQLTDMVEGVVFADGYTGADAMRAAMGWYQFDAGEFDAGAGYRINYIKRGGAAEATLTDSDVVEGPEEWEREDSYERPRVLHIAYQNPIADYGAPVIPIKRTSHDVKVVGERSVAIPFVTSDQDEVARRGDVALTVIYTEIAGTVEVILPISWLALAPTNTIGYSLRERVRRLRMTEWRFSPDGTIKTEWIADRQSAFTSQLTALPAVPTTPPPPSIVGPTVSAVLDIPALADSLDNLHLYAAATGLTEGWWGSVHQRRLPWDSDYTTAATFTRPATIIGVLSDTVADASEHFTDTTNVVRVTFYQDDELETFTQQQFLSENGAFALSWEDSGTRRWEVMQYRDAVRVGDRAWEMSTLARGRLNTETAEHPAGSLLVILDSSVRVMPMQSAWIGEDITHRAVSNGQLPDQAVPYTKEYTGESQREWPVASLTAELDGTDLEVSYVPRHRFGTDDHPVRSVNWDGYRVTATDGANTETVDTLADFHTFDVTGWTTPITVSVSQLNRFTGEGPAVTEEVA